MNRGVLSTTRTPPGFLSGVPMAIAIAALLIPTSTSIPTLTMASSKLMTAEVTLLGDGTPLTDDGTALIMAGSSTCCTPATVAPGPPYTTLLNQLFVSPQHPGYTPVGVFTPEQLHPFSGLTSEPFYQSVAQGVTDLNAAILQQVREGNVAVVGISQSASIETVEEENLAALPAGGRPSPGQLFFVLLGDGNNPNGGLLERFDGAYIPSIGFKFFGATPADVYPTDIYTVEYDGYADFPRYPLDILADLNAVAGIAYVHGTSPQLALQGELPHGLLTVGDTMTHYYIYPTEDLPLLDPLRELFPVVGNPLADLLQPDLTVLVNLGYGNPEYGWSTAPANVATPAGLFPTDINPIAVLVDLASGTVQGVDNALVDLGLPSLPNPVLSDLADLASNIPQTLPSLLAAPNLPFALALPPQIVGVIDSTLNGLDASLNTVINAEVDPAIQSAVYAVGDSLRGAPADVGPTDQVTNAIYASEQLLPILLEAPGNVLTNDTHYLVTGVEDLAAGNLSGFSEELQLIPAFDTLLATAMVALPLLAFRDIVLGVPFDL